MPQKKKTVIKGNSKVARRKVKGDKAITGKSGSKSYNRKKTSVTKDGEGGKLKYSRTKKRTRKRVGGGTKTVEKGKVFTPMGSSRYKTVTKTSPKKKNKKSQTVHKTVRYL